MAAEPYSWKIDPAIRAWLADPPDEPLPVMIETAPDTPNQTRQTLREGGFQVGGADRTWQGSITPEQVPTIAALEGVTYLASSSVTVSSNQRSPRPYRPPKPAKRGHTKLPPRRD